ncbi:MAG: transglycosylase SLT domain-containing protein [Tidjanibacter sp.]|nr:transglycosylase SLT domain-containing protein [Tidjanibacter sp.]
MKTHTTKTSLQQLLPTLLLTICLAVGCTQQHLPTEVLRVAISQEVAGCTVVGGERYGFASDLADTMARRQGLNLRLTNSKSTEQLQAGLRNGTIDIAIIPRTDRVHFHAYTSECCYTSDYALLKPSWSRIASGETTLEAWQGKRILADCNFRNTQSYKALDEGGIEFNKEHIAGTDMASMLLKGKADAIICERSEAELLRFLHRNLVEVATIEEPCEVIFIFANRALKESFVNSLSDFSTTDDYAYMVDVYFGPVSIAERFTQLLYRPTRVMGGISVWDGQLQKISAEMGVDWRLMSAMAYHESRFRNDQISNRGAVGLMQVTPVVAEDLNIAEGYDLADPTTNITLAARILRRYSRALGFGDFPTTDDGLAIMVASYNCGITRTIEAQRLTEQLGGDKQSWSDVSETMRKMNSPEWSAENECRFVRFRDAAVTIAYTEGVMNLYRTYREAIE